MTIPSEGRPTSEGVYLALRDRICLLDLAPGAPLKEQALAKEYGVSRTPIREALTMLRMDGLVTARDGGGSSVSIVDLKSLRDVYALRMKLAELIGDFMIVPVPQAVIDSLRQLRTEVEAAAPNHDPRQLGVLYNRLHEAILQTVANEPLRAISDRLYRQTARIWIELLPEMDWDEEVRTFLEEIDDTIEALEGGSARYMAELRAKHMAMLLTRFNAFLTRPLI